MPFDRRHSRQSLPWRLLQRFMQGLFRQLFRLSGRHTTQAGFVFPTTLLLILMVTLTAGALTYRAYTRSNQVILQRQQQIVSNTATPAVDRAKAKLEYLFSRDLRPTPKVPPSDALDNLLRATTANMLTGGNYTRLAIRPLSTDIYTLEDETRIDLDKDGKLDNAWMFNADVNGDGTIDEANEVVVYSLLVDHQKGQIGYSNKDDEKADQLVVRNSPLTTQANNPCLRLEGEEAIKLEEPISGEGWSRINAIRAEKTFQVDVFAADLSDKNVANTVDTIEFQQIREASLANKWGAWFRYDLELHPGPEFNWNGAMHTQGSLFLANDFNAYMISSAESCAYDDGASEITVGAENADTGFKGQLVSGYSEAGYNNDVDEGAPTIHVENDASPKAPDIVDLDGDKDTVDSAVDTSVTQIHLDPIKLHLNDESVHISKADWTQDRQPEDSFPDRIRNISPKELVRISLDDTFRADNRYGPRKVYDRNQEAGKIPDGTDIGTNIGTNSLLTDNESGLDGYWERRAVQEGARFIVGQRLELGNANGWNYNPRLDEITVRAADDSNLDKLDPLLPPNSLPTTARRGEDYQRKSLRDNLAAVQGMVVYHYETGSGLSPAVCLATTAHFGTYDAIANSRTFRLRLDKTTDPDGNSIANPNIVTDFLTGHGTNGWEFAPVDPSGTEMQKALTNLAQFAGDPEGGAPSFTPVQESGENAVAHPYPYLAMWGDYSVLNRVLSSGNGSIADQSTEDTAACTLALLAYNLDVIEKEHNEAKTSGIGSPTAQTYNDLATNLADVIATGSLVVGRTQTAFQGEIKLPSKKVFTLEDWKAKLNGLTNDAELKLLLDIGWHHRVVKRDRALGFNTSGLSDSASPGYEVDTATYTVPANMYVDVDGSGTESDGDLFYNTTDKYKTYCDPADLKASGEYNLTGADADARALTLAIALCQGPHYPALYYVFPTVSHDVDGDADDAQPDTEEYIDEALDTGLTFEPVTISTIAATPKAPGSFKMPTFEAASENKFELKWSDDENPDDRPWDVVVTSVDGTTASAFGMPVLDKVVYLGRENMAARLLDIHVGQFIQNNNGSNTWFAGKDSEGNERFGLTYAFREDAAREDSIVRPAKSDFATCGNYDVYKAYAVGNIDCYAVTAANVLDWSDPPLSPDHQISLKPVDYIPDPMRKPYGFRLREGQNFNRPANTASGLTFISDDVVAIQGNFNLHTKATVNPLEEEFKTPETIFDKDPATGNEAKNGDFYKAFYERTAANANPDFANPGESKDKWRPAEVLGDAVFLLSNDFKDGFAEAPYAANASEDEGSGVTTFQYEETNFTGEVSFQNMNRPYKINTPDRRTILAERADYIREGGWTERGDAALPSPIFFNRNGKVYYATGTVATPNERSIPGAEYDYAPFLGTVGGTSVRDFRRHGLFLGSDTTINALIISGTPPLRAGQGYGGLHNFPRFNEAWKDKKLQIAGGFFQLFFSHTATAPYDMDAWEYNQVPNPTDATVRNIEHYTPPQRVWGYDVALQYAATPPISSRFISVGAARSEFSRELPVDDPYISILKTAACKELSKTDGLCS